MGTYQGGAGYARWRGKAFTSNCDQCFSARCFSPCLWPLPLLCGSKDCFGWGQRHRVHPLAGQGANLGFGDVCELADQVQEMVLVGAGLGHRDYLKRYESARLQHNVPTMLGIDGLQKLYCTSLPPLVIARSLGLALTSASTPLRNLLQSHASV